MKKKTQQLHTVPIRKYQSEWQVNGELATFKQSLMWHCIVETDHLQADFECRLDPIIMAVNYLALHLLIHLTFSSRLDFFNLHTLGKKHRPFFARNWIASVFFFLHCTITCAECDAISQAHGHSRANKMCSTVRFTFTMHKMKWFMSYAKWITFITTKQCAGWLMPAPALLHAEIVVCWCTSQTSTPSDILSSRHIISRFCNQEKFMDSVAKTLHFTSCLAAFFSLSLSWFFF